MTSFTFFFFNMVVRLQFILQFYVFFFLRTNYVKTKLVRPKMIIRTVQMFSEPGLHNCKSKAGLLYRNWYLMLHFWQKIAPWIILIPLHNNHSIVVESWKTTTNIRNFWTHQSIYHRLQGIYCDRDGLFHWTMSYYSMWIMWNLTVYCLWCSCWACFNRSLAIFFWSIIQNVSKMFHPVFKSLLTTMLQNIW